jgi:hypothetical protein
MARVFGARQQRVQYFYDTDFLAAGVISTGVDLAQSEKELFAAATPGNKVRTNMPAAGFLTGDQTFMCFAVRHEVQFWGGTVPAGSQPSALAAFGTTAAVAIWTIALSTYALQIDDKVEFEGPISMTPAGGGPWGFIDDSNQPLITNGEPQTKAIYVLPLPIAVTKRQGIRLIEKKSNVTSTVTINILNMINNYSGGKLFRGYIDGVNTRNVQ